MPAAPPSGSRAFARRWLSPGLRQTLAVAGRQLAACRTQLALHLARLRLWGRPYGTRVRLGKFRVTMNDGPNFFIQYKDEFIHRSYHFEAARPDPLIIDGGSNIGMSILYFKSRYPAARIIGFEPDPAISAICRENIARNDLRDVTLIDAGLGAQAGERHFAPDGTAGGALDPAGTMTVRVEPLSPYLAEPVDFLKLNIEGAEWEVLQECGARLRQVREMVIEYHHLPGLPRTLHRILALLDDCGFEYLLHTFDRETNPGVDPPFRLDAATRYFLLIYARQRHL